MKARQCCYWTVLLSMFPESPADSGLGLVVLVCMALSTVHLKVDSQEVDFTVDLVL